MMVVLVLAATLPLVLLPVLLGSTEVQTDSKKAALPMLVPSRRAQGDPISSGLSKKRTVHMSPPELPLIAKGAK